MKIIKKAWILQNNIESRWKQRRTTRKQRYDEFLKHPNRKLPDKESLVRCRNNCFLIILFINIIFLYQFFFYWETVWVFPGDLIYQGVFIFSFMIGIFACIFDYALYKRFGNKISLLDWEKGEICS